MKRVVVDFKDLGKAVKAELDGMQKQIRHAQVLAVNNTAYKIKKELEAEHRKVFKVRNEKFPKSYRVVPAKAGSDSPGAPLPVAKIEFPHDWMVLHTRGGTKTAFKGSDPRDKGESLVTPLRDTLAKGYNPKTGAFRQRDKPLALLKLYDEGYRKRAHALDRKRDSESGRFTSGAVHVGQPKAFIMHRKGKCDLIARRDKDDRSLMRFYYAFVGKSAHIVKRLDFDAICQKVAEANLRKEFEKALKWAMENSK